MLILAVLPDVLPAVLLAVLPAVLLVVPPEPLSAVLVEVVVVVVAVCVVAIVVTNPHVLVETPGVPPAGVQYVLSIIWFVLYDDTETTLESVSTVSITRSISLSTEISPNLSAGITVTFMRIPFSNLVGLKLVRLITPVQ